MASRAAAPHGGVHPMHPPSPNVEPDANAAAQPPTPTAPPRSTRPPAPPPPRRPDPAPPAASPANGHPAQAAQEPRQATQSAPPTSGPSSTPAERLAAATRAAEARLAATGAPSKMRPGSAPPRETPPDPEVSKKARKALARERKRALGRLCVEEAVFDAGLIPSPGPGRKAVDFHPTREDRVRVQTMAGLGFPQDQIVLLVLNPGTNLPIDEATLRDHFRVELARGPIVANSKVAEALWKRATAKGKAGSVAAAKWWTQARMGWREKSVVEVEVRSGVLVPPPAITPTEWIEAQARSNAERGEPRAVAE